MSSDDTPGRQAPEARAEAAVLAVDGEGIRGTASLGVASLANGMLAYVYVALGTRALGAADFAPISVVWSLWALGVAALAFPFQHRVISTAGAGADTGHLRAEQMRLAVLGALACVLLTVALAVTRVSVFDSPSITYPIVSGAAILASALIAIRRGALAGRGDDRAAAATLVAEQLVRVVAGIVVVAFGGGSEAYAWALPVAVVVAVPVGRRDRRGDDASSLDGRGLASTGLVRYLVSIAGGTVFGQLVLTGGPVVLQLLAAPASQVTALFTTLAVARAPFLVAQGTAVGTMRRLSASAASRGPRALRQVVRRTIAATILAAGVVSVGAAVVGPSVLALVFGPDAALSRALTALVAGAAVLATGSLVLTLAQIATHRVGAVLAARSAGLAAFAAIVVLMTSSPVSRVVVAFGISEALVFAIVAAAALAATSRHTS